MKSRKVLLGLFVGICVCIAGTATAQKANFQSNNLVEIGPDNIGGRVTSLVVQQQLDDYSVLYAGAATGGLYTRTNKEEDIWNYVPCYMDGKEITLPISKLLKFNDSIIVIATGESTYAKGSNLNKMSALGRGLFLFNCKETNPQRRFTQINGTAPGTNFDADFAAINDMAVITLQGVSYFFVATEQGLFRWNIAQESNWNNAPARVFTGSVRSLALSKQYNRCFFTSKGSVYKISDVIGNSQPVNITSSCEAFGSNASAIDLALAPNHEDYLYAMVANRNGLLSGLFMTRNTNSWQLLSTSTVTPYTSYATSKTCGAITVSPVDSSKVIMGGANVWIGKGYVPNSPYQWTVSSSDEYQLNGGNYMAMVYSNAMFVHSGIHQIVPDVRWDAERCIMAERYYVVTDGGVYYAQENFSRFENYNRGMNSVQINGLAVCPDGSIISGANANACPYIESRVAHNGGVNDSTWYDNSGSNMNHLANIIWKGNGGKVAASRFNQYLPISRRPIFVSSANGSIGRSYGDYSDYTNTQTWTSDIALTTEEIENGPAIGQIVLWETNNNIYSNDSLTFIIDTLGSVRRNHKDTTISQNFQIKAGDSIMVLDHAHAGYPFWHAFDHNFTVKNELRHTVHSPYVSRMLAVTVEKGFTQNSNVSYCWFPTDFRQTYNSPDIRMWVHIYAINGAIYPHLHVRYTAMSYDGNCAFVVVENDTLNRSYIARVRGLNNVDYNGTGANIFGSLNYRNSARVTTTDTLIASAADGDIFFARRISSITTDPRPGVDGIIVTFDGYNADGPNVVYIANASKSNYTINNISLPTNIPAYSALVEYTKGEVYVGTEDGVFKKDSVEGGNWQEYGAFKGVPVTAMYQVTNNNSLIRYIDHDGPNEVPYVFPKTKWAYAMYFGTYGRGIFMDSTYVVNHENEIVSRDIYLDIPTVMNNGSNSVRFFPNPAIDNATMELTVAKPGNAYMRIYDLSGKVVYSENLGVVGEGVHTRTINCQTLQHGMYLVNVVVGGQKATSKLIVR